MRVVDLRDAWKSRLAPSPPPPKPPKLNYSGYKTLGRCLHHEKTVSSLQFCPHAKDFFHHLSRSIKRQAACRPPMMCRLFGTVNDLSHQHVSITTTGSHPLKTSKTSLHHVHPKGNSCDWPKWRCLNFTQQNHDST